MWWSPSANYLHNNVNVYPTGRSRWIRSRDSGSRFIVRLRSRERARRGDRKENGRKKNKTTRRHRPIDTSSHATDAPCTDDVATVLGCKCDLSRVSPCTRARLALKFYRTRSARMNKMYREKLVRTRRIGRDVHVNASRKIFTIIIRAAYFFKSISHVNL